MDNRAEAIRRQWHDVRADRQATTMGNTRYQLDLVAFLAFIATVFTAVSLASYSPADPPSSLVWPLNNPPVNLCGRVGAWLAAGLYDTIGAAAWLLLVAAAVAVVLLFARRRPRQPLTCMAGWLLLLATTATLADIAFGRVPTFPLPLPGGTVGVTLHRLLVNYFSSVGMYLLLSAALTTGLLLVCEALLVKPVVWTLRVLSLLAGHLPRAVRSATARLGRLRSELPALPAPPANRDRADAKLSGPDRQETRQTAAAESTRAEPAAASADSELPVPKLPPSAPDRAVRSLPTPASESGFSLPPLDLLDDPEPFPYEKYREEVVARGRRLKQALAEFGYHVELRDIHTGPVITQYEVALESGLRVGKIHSVADDLAIALKAASVRVVAPIPGKDTVGIEVPNRHRQYVRLKEVIRAAADCVRKMEIPLFLGKDVRGNPLVYDLAQMPHLLIAGRTGTGKSVCLNALILSVLFTRTPDQVKLLMIDPKMVELSPYRRIPHLMHPVVTDMKKAEALLAWAVDKMEERYDLLARAGVRHLKAYNKLGAEELYRRLQVEDDEARAQVPVRMPYILIFADEMADLMMTAPKEIEGHIIRLAQKSRAVGIHLVFATQKPTVDVITGLIKSNLPARICFQVSSRSDSRVVLDEMGAEKLLGNGDMLFLIPGTSQTVRAQGTYVADHEIERVVEFFESRYEPQYSKELMGLARKTKNGGRRAQLAKERDELYDEAVEIVLRERRGSTSLLQRALGIGYGRAARLIDHMAEDGIVGEYNGSQAREVLITLEEWRAMQQQEAAAEP